MWQWVSDLAVTLAPVGVILGVLSGLLGVIYGVYRLRKVVLQIIDFFSRLLGTAQAAVDASSTAAAASSTAAESSRVTEKAAAKATEANADVHDSVVLLAEAYGRTVTRLEEALALAQTAQQLLDSRVLRLEEHLAAAEVRRHRQREGVPE